MPIPRCHVHHHPLAWAALIASTPALHAQTAPVVTLHTRSV